MAGFPDWPDDDEPRSTSAALARCWSFSLFSHWFGAATPHGAVLRSELVGRIGADLGCDLRLGHCADPVGMGRSGGWIDVCGTRYRAWTAEMGRWAGRESGGES